MTKTITGPEHGIPFAPHLEAEVVPTADRIASQVRALLGAA